MATTDITYRLLGNATGAVKAFGKTQEAGDKLRNKLKGVAGVALGAAGVGGVGALVGSLAGAAQSMETIRQKSATVFEDSLGDVEAWAGSINKNLGLSRTELVGLAADMGDLLKPMGFTAEQAAVMAQDTLGLAGALSEWTGGQRSSAEVADILSKAMLGEREQLKSLGISINQAEVDQRALTIAQKDGRTEITAQDKALATQQLIFEKSTDAQEAFAAGGNQLLRTQNKVKATFKELRDTLASNLIPVVFRAIEVFSKVAGWFQRNKDVAAALGVAVGVLAGAAGIQALVGAVLALNAAMALNPAVALTVAIAALAAGVVIAYQRSETFRDIVDSVAEAFMKLVDVISEHWPTIWKVLEPQIELVKTAIQSIVQVFSGVVSGVRALVNGDWAGVWRAFRQIIRAQWELAKTYVRLQVKILVAIVTGIGALLATAGRGMFRWLVDQVRGLPDKVLEMAGALLSAGLSLGGKIIDGIVSGIKKAPGAIKDAIASLIPGSGLVGSIARKVPFFADGGIAKPGSPFLAVLGDNTRETEIISPVSTMKQAFADVLAGTQTLAGGPQVIEVYIGEERLDRILVNSANRTQRRTGRFT